MHLGLGYPSSVPSHPYSPEHPVLHAVARRQLTPFLDPTELRALVAGHGTVELYAGPYALGLQLRRDLNSGCGSCWGGGERARGACRDMMRIFVDVCECVIPDTSLEPRKPPP